MYAVHVDKHHQVMNLRVYMVLDDGVRFAFLQYPAFLGMGERKTSPVQRCERSVENLYNTHGGRYTGWYFSLSGWFFFPRQAWGPMAWKEEG